MRTRPSQHAEREEDRSRFGDGGQTVSTIEARQIRDDDGACQEMDRYRPGHERDRPSARFLDGLQIDRRSVKAQAPAENRKNECASNDAPAEERCLHAANHAVVALSLVTVAAEILTFRPARSACDFPAIARRG